MNTPTDNSLQVEALRDWLQAEPDADLGLELGAVQQHWRGMRGLELAPQAFGDVLDQFYGRMSDMAERCRVRLTEADLPLPRDFRQLVGSLADSCVELAEAYLDIAHEASADLALSDLLGDEFLGARALDLLGEAWVLAAMGGMDPRYDLWRTAHGLFLALGGSRGLLGSHRDNRTMRAYKRLLALSVVQPESCSAREIGWVADFLQEEAGAVVLQPLEAGASGGYWVDSAMDTAPVALARRPPPPVDGLLHLITTPLGRLVTARLERLGHAPDGALDDAVEAVVTMTVEADLPEGLAARELVPLLRRLRQHWAMPPLRERPRRRRHYPVEVCHGLRAIWDMSQHGEAAAKVAEWEVVNEGPLGLAMTSAAGAHAALRAGMVLALRREGRQEWSLGVIRWIRTEHPAQVEVGLQIVANGVTPVRLGFQGGEVREMVHGLLLEPLGELRRHQAILAPAGTSSSPRFVFVHEDQHVHVAQGRLLSLDVQTPCVELFQFEVDPSPM